MTESRPFDVAVIGAGLAGLHCAQLLKQRGDRVVVVEKSRGLGGRLATRRLENSWADHGVRCLEDQGPLTRQLIQQAEGSLQLWTKEIFEFQPGPSPATEQSVGNILAPSSVVHPRYAAAEGITTVAKVLARDLEIWRGQRVVSLNTVSADPTTAAPTWQLTLEPLSDQPTRSLTAKAVAIAIPAPQALALLEPLLKEGLSAELVEQLQSVTYAPCITAIARYPKTYQLDASQLLWRAVQFPSTTDLAWVGHESSKGSSDRPPTFVFQSSAPFAQKHLDAANLEPLGQVLVQQAAAALCVPWLTEPDLLQVHRWRYAFVQQSLPQPCLMTRQPAPLICGGDWCGGNNCGGNNCGGNNLEAALQSGQAIAQHLQ